MPAAGGPPATLVELLAERARQDPGRVAYRFLANGEEEVESLSLGELDAGARRIAAELIGRGLAGERVLLLYPPGLGFVQAFLACLYARAVAVPAYPPQSERGLPRLVAMVRDAAPRGVLSPAGELSLARARDGARGELTGLEWVATDGLTGPVPAPGPGPRPDDLAFLQYTSGSTSTPKGVMVTHANLMDNEAVIRRAFGMQASDVVVGWLPLYHDMGLIGNVIQPLFSGASCVLMSPVAFLQQPRRWLAAIDRYRGTVSGGPNFAYDLCLRRLAPAVRAGLDLSSWRVAFNGAEPIRAGTLAAFAAGFAPQGFRSRAFFPCYGLAEATLFVSGTGAGAGSHVLAAEGGPSRVSSGAVAWGPEVRVVDPQTALPRAEGEEGEIWVRGGSVAAGYWGRPQASAATFGARLADGDGPFLRTGDLGFLVAGELFVTGRSKDLLIVRGRNHHPQDVELTAERASAALRPGCGAAFAIEPEDGEGAERVVLVFEVDRHSDQPIEVVAQAVRAAVAEEHELRLAELVLIRASTLPKTSSGKVQRHACRELYRRGELAVVGASRAPQAEELAAPPAAQPLSPEELASLAGEALQPGLERHLAARLVSLVGEPPAGYLDLPLASLGLDSLAAVELQHRLELDLGAAPGLDEVLAGASVRELAAGLAARLAARREAPTEAPTAEAVAVASTRSGAAAKRAPATAGQASLWYVEQLAPGRAVYNLPVACRLGAGVSPQALTRAWRELVARHPALRTTFREEADGLWLEEHGELVADLEALPSPASEEGLAAVLAAAAWEPFDLAAGPPARLRTLALADGGTLALFVVHHAVADFWSLTVLLRELAALLAAAPGVALGAVELPPPGPSPLGLAARERQRLAGAEAAALWSYWQARLTPLPPGLDLPLDRPRPARLSFAGATLARPLPPVVARAAAALARRQAATPFAVLFAATVAWLGRLAGARRLAVGTPAASRAAAELATTVGYLVNPLVLVEELAPSEAFTALVERVRGTVLGALAHQGLPFPVLAERLGGPRDPSRSPLFDVLFVLDRSPLAAAPGLARLAAGLAGPAVEVEGLVLAPVALPSRRAAFDLTVRLVETGDGLAAVLNYATDLFDATTVERWLGAFEVLLSGALADPTVAVGHLTLLSASQREQLLALAEGGEVADPGALLPALFAGQAAASPEAVALWDRAEQLSYGELARRVGKVAAGLRAAGVGPEVRVAVEMERTVALPTALLAVLSAGGATVPVDPAYPAARREFMLADSGAHLVVSDERFAGLLAAASAGETSAVPLLAANLATLIYTSGSTGTPKAVAVTHGSLAALLGWAAGAHSDAEIAVVLASTSVCFDISAFELYVPLTRGGRVVMAANVLELGELPAAGSLTLVNTVPSPFAEVLRAGVLPPSLVTVNLAGEPLPAALAAGIYTQGRVSRVLDLYGPSEDTVFSTWAEVPRPAGGEAGAKPLIGRPLPGTRALVLEPLTGPQGANLALLGVPGELFLAGAGLARGYLGRPGLTASRFVPCPSLWASEPGERLYRTGDLVRQLPDGSLDYLGRLDQQVKLRGFRLELGEIEAALARHPAVVEAAVAVQASPDGEPQLVAYWCQRPEAATPAAGELAEHLRQRLPAFAVPGHLRAVAALPRTASGKLDRRSLPALGAGELAAAPGGPAVAPRSAVEEILVSAFEELLGVRGIGTAHSFFELGGHSLLATRLVSRVRDLFAVELPVVAVLEAPTVAALAARIQELGRLGLPVVAPIPAAPRGGPLPLSWAQQRLWLASQQGGRARAYHVPLAVALDGPLAAPALGAAFRALVARHEALRTVFPLTDDGPVQLPRPALAVTQPLVDLGGLPASEARRAAERLLAAEARRPFDLAHGPLLRVGLLRLAADRHWLALTFHHLVADGWSLGVVIRELPALYAAALTGTQAALPPLAIQVADHATWERAQGAAGTYAADLAYWREQLAELDGELALPTDRPRGAAGAGEGSVVERRLPEALSAAVEGLARRLGATPFMCLSAGLDALLYRLTGETDLAVGTPIANRRSSQLEGLIGCFVNTLVLRVRAAASLPFAELLARSRRASLGAYAHQALPFELLVEALQPPRASEGTPFFRVLFVLQNLPLPPLELPGLAVSLLPTDTGAAQFDLSLAVREDGGALHCALEYDRGLFDRTTVERWLAAYERLLSAVVAAPERRLGEIELLSPAERQQLLAAGNDSRVPPAVPDLPSRIFEVAARRPEAIAVVHREGGLDAALSYGELAGRSARLAARLRAAGVGPEVMVGVLAERSPAAIVGFLAVLAAGGAYVPLDPAFPPVRSDLLLADARAALLLVGDAAAAPAVAAGLPRLTVPRDLPAGPALAPLPAVPPEAAAYVLYTSGSTGRPKGVVVPRGALSRYCLGIAATYQVQPADHALQMSALSFDASAEEIYATLLSGATLLLRDGSLMASFEALVERLAAWQISILNLPTALWHQVAAALLAGEIALPDCVRLTVIGGERAQPELLAAWRRLAPGRLVNTYGPTEATIAATASEQGAAGGAAMAFHGSLRAAGDLGRPLAGASAQVAGPRLGLAPLGAPGELLLGGCGLARGYLGRPALTAARFFPDPWGGEPGGRLLATGDRARRLADGSLEFSGRGDRQVKVRGFRIELGEIEAALLGQPGVREAAVITRAGAGGDARLLAYVVAEQGAAPVPAALRAALAATLPAFAVPAAISVLPALPLTRHGKLDQRALPEPAEPAATLALAAERSPSEEIVAAIWAEVLGLAGGAQGLRAEDDFFALGGHSLLATQVGSRLRRRLGVELSLEAIFAAPSLGRLAAAVAAALAGGAPTAAESTGVPPIRRREVAGPRPLSLAQERLWFLDRLHHGSPFYNLAGGLRLAGELDVERLAVCLGRLVARHEALRTRFGSVAGEGRQWVEEGVELVLPVVDLGGLPAAVAERQAGRCLAALGELPFDLGRAPLLRALLVRRGARAHDLALALHHIVGDAWALAQVSRELTALYEAGGDAAVLPPLAISYPDYADWQRELLAGPAAEALLAYWRRQLAEPLPGEALVPDQPRPAEPSFAGAMLPVAVPAELVARLRALAQAEGATLFMVLLAAFLALLHRRSGATDLAVGTNVAHRNRFETESVVGFFVNALVLRCDLGGEPSFRELVARVRATTIGAYAHQDLPFHKLVEELKLRRDASRNPLFQVMFLLHTAPAVTHSLAGLEVNPLEVELTTSVFDLTLAFEEAADGSLRGSARYSTALFAAATLEQLLASYLGVLAQVVARPAAALAELSVAPRPSPPAALAGEPAAEAAGARERKLARLLSLQARRPAPGPHGAATPGEAERPETS